MAEDARVSAVILRLTREDRVQLRPIPHHDPVYGHDIRVQLARVDKGIDPLPNPILFTQQRELVPHDRLSALVQKDFLFTQFDLPTDKFSVILGGDKAQNPNALGRGQIVVRNRSQALILAHRGGNLKIRVRDLVRPRDSVRFEPVINRLHRAFGVGFVLPVIAPHGEFVRIPLRENILHADHERARRGDHDQHHRG